MLKIENNQIVATEGYLHKTGSAEYPAIRRAILMPGQTIDLYEEVMELPTYTKAEYDAKVSELIRQRYSIDEEFALQRKMLDAMLNPQPATLDENGEAIAEPKAVSEYRAYTAYAEQCKLDAPAAIIADREAEAARALEEAGRQDAYCGGDAAATIEEQPECSDISESSDQTVKQTAHRS